MLIGFSGALRSGKDAAADRLVEKFDYVKLQFGELVSEAMLRLNPIVSAGIEPGVTTRYADLIEVLGYSRTKEIPEARRLLQALGTEVARDLFGENVWVDMMERKVSALLARDVNVTITGVRFPNELAMLHRLGGLSVFIYRPGYEQGGHTSETSVMPLDCTNYIANDGPLEDLYAKVEALHA